MVRLGFKASGNAPNLNVKSVILALVPAPIAPSSLIAEPVFIITSEMLKSLVSLNKFFILPTCEIASSTPPAKSLPKATLNLSEATVNASSSFFTTPNCPPISAIVDKSSILVLVFFEVFKILSPNWSNSEPASPVVLLTSANLSSNLTDSRPSKTIGATIPTPTIAERLDTSNIVRLVFLNLLSIRLREPVIRPTVPENLSTAVNIVGIVIPLILSFYSLTLCRCTNILNQENPYRQDTDFQLFPVSICIHGQPFLSLNLHHCLLKEKNCDRG